MSVSTEEISEIIDWLAQFGYQGDGKGMIRRLSESHPGINIVPIDYDLSATKVNQENRIRLMLAIARDADARCRAMETLIADDEAACASCPQAELCGGAV